MKFYRGFLFTLILLGTITATAQSVTTRYINQKSIGGFISAGFPYYNLEVNVGYHPILIGGYLHLPLFKAHRHFNIAIDVLPQVGIVPFDNNTEYEFGLNISFAFGFALTPRDVLSINVGSGPHYITAQLDRQAHGFIFSDNLNFTLRHKFKVIEAGVTAGIRHISNAGLENPNIGVEDILIGFTIAKPFN
jgi:Lipid A 3-O-deacylase (PagL)